MSNSRYKLFRKCEVAGKIGYEESDESNEALLIGSYVDSYVEGTLDQFLKEHPEVLSTRGKTKGQLKVVFQKAHEICEFIDRDQRIQQFLSGEKQRVMEGTISNVPYKIRMDSFIPGKLIADLKVMRSITKRNGQYFDFITYWGYDIQLAIYQEIVRQNTGHRLPCYIVVVTKEKVTNSAIVQIPQYILDRALDDVRLNSYAYYEIMKGEVEPNGCGVCSACITTRKTTPLISMEELMEGFNEDN